MSQNTSGLKSILSIPFFYNLLQFLLGVTHAEKEVVSRYFKIKDNYSVLDIGCGTAIILDLIPDTVVYKGYDISEEYINLAKKKYKNRKNVSFYVNMVEKSTLSTELFDRIIINKVLHHLNDREVLELFSIVKNNLTKDGRVLTMDPCFVSNQGFISKWIVSHDRGENVRSPEQYQNLAHQIFTNVSTFQRNNLSWVPIDTFIMECN